MCGTEKVVCEEIEYSCLIETLTICIKSVKYGSCAFCRPRRHQENSEGFFGKYFGWSSGPTENATSQLHPPTSTPSVIR